MSKKNRNLPANQGGAQIQRVEQRLEYSGPLPPPAMLEGYELVKPGLVDRMIQWTEDETEHRRALELRRADRDHWKDVLGMILAFILAGGILFGAYRLLDAGKSIAGVAAIVAAMVPLLTAFVFVRRKNR